MFALLIGILSALLCDVSRAETSAATLDAVNGGEFELCIDRRERRLHSLTFPSHYCLVATKLEDPVEQVVENAVSSRKKRLTEETMSPHLRKMEYAVRGKVVIAADEIHEQLAKKEHKFPFDHIVYTNIGNPHSVGQIPLTWPRQVMALVDLPDPVGVDHPHAAKLFPSDAIRRAREIKVGLNGFGTGAYTHSKGAKCFREDIAKFIQTRDGGVPCEAEDIFITNGASAGIGMILQALIADSTW